MSYMDLAILPCAATKDRQKKKDLCLFFMAKQVELRFSVCRKLFNGVYVALRSFDSIFTQKVSFFFFFLFNRSILIKGVE